MLSNPATATGSATATAATDCWGTRTAGDLLRTRHLSAVSAEQQYFLRVWSIKTLCPDRRLRRLVAKPQRHGHRYRFPFRCPRRQLIPQFHVPQRLHALALAWLTD